jgi:nickel-type superoxide dismutase maturation protease
VNQFSNSQVSQTGRIAFISMSRLVEYFVRRVTVEGHSMLPTYVPGERLTAWRRWRSVRVGDVVVVRDPRDGHRWLLKRCVGINGDQLDLRGDNVDASTDSRDFGLVSSREAIWIVPRKQT